MAKITLGGIVGACITSGIWGAVVLDSSFIILTIGGMGAMIVTSFIFWDDK